MLGLVDCGQSSLVTEVIFCFLLLAVNNERGYSIIYLVHAAMFMLSKQLTYLL